MPRSAARRLALLALAAGFVPGCATNPVTGQREFSLVTGAQEEQIGREGYAAVVGEYGLYDDSALQAYVDSVGRKLALVSHLPNLRWKFTVLDDPVVNAFAMPGGYLYLTRGILAHLNSDAQLAGVLGHEMGHVTARHSAQRLTQQQLAGIGLGVAGAFSQGFQRYSQAAETALGLLFLKYGRDDEKQADELGVQYAVAAGYDPREIPATYSMLKRVSDRSGQRLPTFLSTHPDPGAREERTRQLAQQAAAGKSGLLVRGRYYLQRQDGVVFGRDPRHGYQEGSRYYNPSLGFQITFPERWKVEDSRSALLAGSEDQRSLMQLTVTPRSPLLPGAHVAELERSGRILASRGGSERIGGYAAWVGHVEVAGDQGSSATLAAAFIRTSPELLFQVLGRSGEPGDWGDQRILETVRSFRALEAGRQDAEPDRVRVVAASRSGDLQGLVQSLGPQGVGLEEIAVLNNLFPDQPVNAGELIKTVVPGRRRR